MEERIFTRDLPVTLTSEEHFIRSRELADRLRERSDIEAERKECMATFKARLESADASIDALAVVVSASAEVRPVECTEEKDYEKSVVRTVRLDTRTTIDVRAMTDAERQQVLPLVPQEQ